MMLCLVLKTLVVMVNACTGCSDLLMLMLFHVLCTMCFIISMNRITCSFEYVSSQVVCIAFVELPIWSQVENTIE